MAQLEKHEQETELVRWPKYLRVKRDLSHLLHSGQFEAGLPMPSEKTLAKSNGVSVGTVRQALSAMEDEGLIRREQGRGTFVNSVALSQQDAPVNQTVQAMEAFAILLPNVSGFYTSLIQGFDEACNELNHPTILCNTQNDIAQQANYFMRLIDRRISGMAVNTATRGVTPAYQIRQVQQAGIPVVLLRRSVEGVSAPVFVTPSQKIAELAGREIGKRGHRRVAYIANQRYSSAEQYEEGLRIGLAEHGVQLTPDLVHYASLSQEKPEDYLQDLEPIITQMLERKDRPTAIFTGFDRTAETIYVVASRMRIAVPDDLYIVSYSDRRRDGAVQNQIAAVNQDETAIGRQAAEVLNEMKTGKRPIDDDTQFTADLDFYPGPTG